MKRQQGKRSLLIMTIDNSPHVRSTRRAKLKRSVSTTNQQSSGCLSVRLSQRASKSCFLPFLVASLGDCVFVSSLPPSLPLSFSRQTQGKESRLQIEALVCLLPQIRCGGRSIFLLPASCHVHSLTEIQLYLFWPSLKASEARRRVYCCA